MITMIIIMIIVILNSSNIFNIYSRCNQVRSLPLATARRTTGPRSGPRRSPVAIPFERRNYTIIVIIIINIIIIIPFLFFISLII